MTPEALATQQLCCKTEIYFTRISSSHLLCKKTYFWESNKTNGSITGQKMVTWADFSRVSLFNIPFPWETSNQEIHFMYLRKKIVIFNDC